MKTKILLGALAWLLAISGAHVHLNIGWEALADDLRVMLGTQRKQLVVGFLPVT